MATMRQDRFFDEQISMMEKSGFFCFERGDSRHVECIKPVTSKMYEVDGIVVEEIVSMKFFVVLREA